MAELRGKPANTSHIAHSAIAIFEPGIMRTIKLCKCMSVVTLE